MPAYLRAVLPLIQLTALGASRLSTVQVILKSAFVCTYVGMALIETTEQELFYSSFILRIDQRGWESIKCALKCVVFRHLIVGLVVWLKTFLAHTLNWKKEILTSDNNFHCLRINFWTRIGVRTSICGLILYIIYVLN